MRTHSILYHSLRRQHRDLSAVYVAKRQTNTFPRSCFLQTTNNLPEHKPLHIHTAYANSMRAGPVFSSSPLFGPTGLVVAKKSTLIAMAKPVCRARTTMSRILDVFDSVVESTG